MRNRFDKKMAGDRDGICSEAGNFKLHDKRCMCSERMVDGKTELLSTKTKKRVQNQTALYLSVNVVYLCFDMQDLYGTVHWSDNTNDAKTPLWPSK